VVATRSSTTKTSFPACAYTDDAKILRQVWRVEVQITTGEVQNGDTDDNVRIGIGGPINGATGGGAWLDHAGDDFEQGQTHRYDVSNLVGIGELGDIESLELLKPGADEWCVKDVSILVNNSLVFTTSFGPPCEWVYASDIAGSELLKVSHETLRTYPLWNAYQIPLSTILQGNEAVIPIGHDQLEGTIESKVGDSMVGTDGYWGPPDAVHLQPVDGQRAHTDLDLKGRSTGSDVDVDVDFDLVVGTHRDMQGNWILDVTTENVSVDVSPTWWAVWQWLGVLLSGGLELKIAEDGVKYALTGVATHAQVGAFCNVTAGFDETANLIIRATLVCS
jgi:hypothetical protein